VSFITKNKAGRGEGSSGRGGGGGGGSNGAGTQELAVTLGTLAAAALMVLLNRHRASAFVLDRPSVMISRGQHAMREGSTTANSSDTSGGGWRQWIFGGGGGGGGGGGEGEGGGGGDGGGGGGGGSGGAGGRGSGIEGGSRRMFIIAYLGFFRALTAEQRALASAGYGDPAAKCDLLVMLTRTFDLLIDRFPATVGRCSMNPC